MVGEGSDLGSVAVCLVSIMSVTSLLHASVEEALLPLLSFSPHCRKIRFETRRSPMITFRKNTGKKKVKIQIGDNVLHL